jgi:hypothetical protein
MKCFVSCPPSVNVYVINEQRAGAVAASGSGYSLKASLHSGRVCRRAMAMTGISKVIAADPSMAGCEKSR